MDALQALRNSTMVMPMPSCKPTATFTLNSKDAALARRCYWLVQKRALDEMPLAEPDVRISLRSTIDSRDEASHDLHRNEGYQPLRYHWRMEVVLDGPPPVPKFP